MPTDIDGLEEAYKTVERRYRDAGAALETPLTAYIAAVVRDTFPDATTLWVVGEHNDEGDFCVRLSHVTDAGGQLVAGYTVTWKDPDQAEAWVSLEDELSEALDTLGEITGSAYEGRHDIDLDSALTAVGGLGRTDTAAPGTNSEGAAL